MNPSSSQQGQEVGAVSGMWTYPHGLGRTVVADLVGYQVVATDGEIGHVDLATDDIDAAAIVVDTGFWIFGKKRMIPAGVIDMIDAQAQTVSVKMSKDDIKHAPDYVDHVSQGLPDLHRDEVVKYYRRWWG
jgi:hypothetical protein